MPTDLVLTDIRDGYRLLTLNRPDRLNSFNAAMHGALLSALSEAEADKSCRALLITGAGRGFCAGQDLDDVAVKPGETPDLSATIARFCSGERPSNISTRIVGMVVLSSSMG